MDGGDGVSTPLMLCDACHKPCPWSPFTTCSWACFDTRERDGAPEALAYFLGIGAGEETT